MLRDMRGDGRRLGHACKVKWPSPSRRGCGNGHRRACSCRVEWPSPRARHAAVTTISRTLAEWSGCPVS